MTMILEYSLRVFMNTLEPNIIWGRDLISANYQKIKQENWVEFKYFKMMIYLDVSYPAKLKIISNLFNCENLSSDSQNRVHIC